MRIAFDSHVITYFLAANQAGYDPQSDSDASLAEQKVAAFRLFLFSDEDPIVLPTVGGEVEIISDAAIRQEHIVWTHFHWREVLPHWLDADCVNVRAQELAQWHQRAKDANDCRIIAEGEQVRLDVFVTFDTKLIRHLKDHATVFIGTPAECWRRAAVPRGTSPRMVLQPEHPLFNAAWWQW